MLAYFITKARGRFRYPRPQVVVCVPSGITEVEQRAVEDATWDAGGGKVFLIEEAMAAAIGASLPVAEPEGTMVVDVGGGTTEAAVVSYGGIVTGRSLPVGGDELDETIVHHVRKAHAMALGERTAERVKIELGAAHPVADDRTMLVRGRDLASGLPKEIELSGAEVRDAIADPVQAIEDGVRGVLDVCPPELTGDLMERGIVLAGGGALLRGFDARLEAATGTPVHVADDPLTCVARGAGLCLEEVGNAHGMFLSARIGGRRDLRR